MASYGRYILTAVVMLFWSCSSDKPEEEKIVAEWLGKRIILPDYVSDALTGDTICLTDADFTILNYVDSGGCTSCNLRLPMWDEFNSSLDTITDYQVNIIMIVNTADENEVKYLLKRDAYRYPVFIDKKNEIYQANSFPVDHAFRTFLLDKSHHVIAVGSPVAIPNIATLYRSVLSGERTVSIADRLDVSVTGDPYLGNLRPEAIVERRYRLNNNGEDTVHISKILPSCDCVTASVDYNTIAPHEGLDVFVTLIADTTSGPFNRNVNIYYIEIDNPSIIKIKGNITES